MSRLLEVALASGICPRCNTDTGGEIDEQYSYGVYAGVMCTDCAIRGFSDQCGHRPQGQGTPREYTELTGERYWEED